MKKIEDVLHLYLGCDVFAGTHRCKLKRIEDGAIVLHSLQGRFVIPFCNIIPILRPLSDMTEEEVIHLVYLRSNIFLNVRFLEWFYQDILFEFEYKSSSRRRKEKIDLSQLNTGQFKQILEWQFDLFDLIPSGLAIDKTTLK